MEGYGLKVVAQQRAKEPLQPHHQKTKICCKTKVGWPECPLTWEHHPPDMLVPHPALMGIAQDPTQTTDGIQCARIMSDPRRRPTQVGGTVGKSPHDDGRGRSSVVPASGS